jgi:predicted lipid-binding transport protein (Tim44 family)
MSSFYRLAQLFKVLALSAALALAPAIAQAKMGGGGSFGSRGTRTFSPPPSTRTAPGAAAPMERSITPRGDSMFGQGAAPSPSGGLFGGGFGRGLLGGLAGGLLGAGLIGLFTGHGLLGGMGGFMSIIGLLLQIALIVFIAKWAIGWFMRSRLAGAGGAPGGTAQFARGGPGPGPAGFGAFGTGLGGGTGRPPQGAPLTLAGDDFSAFEQLLGESQGAYSREDIGRLRALTTPEMSRYFEEELAANASKGVVNRISNVKLLQGDLSEAWREGADEYATVAMRFALTDVFEDKTTGKVVSGDPVQPTQSTEVWTFRRPAGRGPEAWKLSAIQQTA